MTQQSERSAEQAWMELESFLRDRRYLSPREVLKPDRDIRWELGIDGNDAAAFIPDFFHTFQLKEGDFLYVRYFGREGCNPFAALLTLLPALFFRSYREEIREEREASKVTPRMLQRAIQLGVWDNHRLRETENTPPRE